MNWFEILLWTCVIGVFSMPIIDRVIQRRMKIVRRNRNEL